MLCTPHKINNHPLGNRCLHTLRLNFSDMEIEIFCSTFDADGNAMFTLNEIADIADGKEPGE